MDMNLKRKARSAVVKFILVLGLLIFLPAGTLDFWQGWVYLFVFSECVVITTAYFLKRDPVLVERRMRAGPIAEQEKKQRVIQSLAALLFVLLVVVPGLDHRYGWSDVPVYLIIAGDALVVAGFWITFLVMKENSYAASTIEVEEGQTVISTGPYRVVRHPMYSGGLLMLIFTPFALGSYWALLVGPPMLAVILWRLLEEEKFLLKNLPGYEEYRRKTRYRLVPFIW